MIVSPACWQDVEKPSSNRTVDRARCCTGPGHARISLQDTKQLCFASLVIGTKGYQFVILLQMLVRLRTILDLMFELELFQPASRICMGVQVSMSS